MQFLKSLTFALLTALAAAAPTDLSTRATTLSARNLEYVSCYGFGASMDRSVLVSAIDAFCGAVIGKYFPPGHVEYREYIWSSYKIIIEAKAEGGCSFTVDNNCSRLLRMPVDMCNTNGVNGKQGGYVYEVPTCGWWRIDPQQGNTRIALDSEESAEPVTLKVEVS